MQVDSVERDRRGDVLAGQDPPLQATGETVPGWKQPRVIVLAMAALGMALFIVVALSRQQAEPDLVRAVEAGATELAQPLPQPVVPAPEAAPVAAAPAAPISAPAMSPSVAGQAVVASSAGEVAPAPVQPAAEEAVHSPADGVYVGVASSQVQVADAGSAPAAATGAGMTEAELRDWRRRNAESMKVLEATTPEVAGAGDVVPPSVQSPPRKPVDRVP